jgi:hypothetical protein
MWIASETEIGREKGKVRGKEMVRERMFTEMEGGGDGYS